MPDSTPTREIRSAAVIGAGTMGTGIAINFLNAGIPVHLLEVGQEALDKGLAIIRKNYENTMKKGRLKPEQVEERMGLIKGTLSYDDVKNADSVIEAVFEDMAVKVAVDTTPNEVMTPVAVRAGEMAWSPDRNPSPPSSAMPSLARRRARPTPASGSPPRKAPTPKRSRPARAPAKRRKVR